MTRRRSSPSINPQPIQIALDALAEAGFDTLTHLTEGGWLLRWRRRGERWYAMRASLDDLAESVAGWLQARRTRNGQESHYAHQGDAPRGPR